MLKMLTITGAILTLTGGMSGQPNKATYNKQPPASQSHPAIVSANAPDEQNRSDKRQSKSSSYPPEWYAALKRPEWWLVILGFPTLVLIGWQAWETRKAAIAGERSASAALNQIDLVVDKKRAKLRIELKPFNPYQNTNKGTFIGYVIEGTVSIYGITSAYVERSEIYARIGLPGISNPQPEWPFPLNLPNVIAAGSAPIPFTTHVNGFDGFADGKEMATVLEGEDFIYCTAMIEFVTDFKQRWAVRLRMKYSFIWPPIDEETAIGGWDAIGSDGENGEYRLEEEQRQNPN